MTVTQDAPRCSTSRDPRGLPDPGAHGRRTSPLVYLDSANTSARSRARSSTPITDYYEQHNANLYRARLHARRGGHRRCSRAPGPSWRRSSARPVPATIVFNRGTTESIEPRRARLGHGSSFARATRSCSPSGAPLEPGALAVRRRRPPARCCGSSRSRTTAARPLRRSSPAHRADEDRRRHGHVERRSGRCTPLRAAGRRRARGGGGRPGRRRAARPAPPGGRDRARLSTSSTISGHKMLGPTASGGLYGQARAARADGPVPRRRRDDPSRSTPTTRPSRTSPAKFEAGTMNIAQEIGLAAAIDYLRRWAWTPCARTRRRSPPTRSSALAGGRRDGVRADGRRARAAARSRSGIKDIHPHDLAQVLDTGGRVRSGPATTAPSSLMRPLGVPGHGPGVVLRVQHEGGGGRAGRGAREGGGRLGSRRDRLALDELYKEVILDHYKNPRNKRDLPGRRAACSKNNPLCGDEITVYAHVDGRHGRRASRSRARGVRSARSSASMMTEAVDRQSRSRTPSAWSATFRGHDGRRGRARRGRVRRPRRAEGRREVPGPHQVRRARVGCAAGGPAGDGAADGSVPHAVG